MFKMQYLVPEGYPSVKAELDHEVAGMLQNLKGIDAKDTKIPNSALSVKIEIMLNGANFEIKKRGQPAYINLFCFGEKDLLSVFSVVQGYYHTFNLGTPKKPVVPTWIHSIPIAHDLLRENELILCHKMTVVLYWKVFYQHLKRSNPMN